MDVDMHDDMPQSSPQSTTRRFTVPVDDAHPFDLDSYISNYTGRTAVDRLIHIISICPQIAPQAFQLAVQHIQQLRDLNLYKAVVSVYCDQLPSGADADTSKIANLDPNWRHEMVAKNQAERAKLELELKNYSNNLLKESTRMAHRELGDFYRATGDSVAAMKHYTKSREFCTTSQHILEMCLSIIELLIDQRNYNHIPTYVFKADAALDAANTVSIGTDGGTGTGTGAGTASAPTGSKKSAEREKSQAKLDFATALSHLGQGNYEKAARAFLNIGSPGELGDWIGNVVAPGDIAIYGTLCAMASLSRSSVKSQILDNTSFSVYIEQEPYVRELVEAYMNSNFKTVLELLSQYSTQHYLDIHLATHLHDLTNLIRNAGVVLYFQPFVSIKLERMGAVFGWSVEEVERQVVALIQSGDIKGRVDSQNKILQAKKTDYRAELFARAIRTVTDMQNANRKLLLRMRLQQADLIVKPAKGSQANTMQLSEMLQIE